MLEQCLNALIKARVPTTIWFLSLMSPLRKSTKIRGKKVISLIPMIPTKWYGNHMVCSGDRRTWKCPCKLLKIFLAANLTLKGVFFFFHSFSFFHFFFIVSKETSGICTGNGIHMMKSLQKTTLRKPKILDSTDIFKNTLLLRIYDCSISHFGGKY